MSIDPTPPSEDLPAGSTEAVRGGTKTKFNFVVLVAGLALVIVLFAVLALVTAGGRQNIEADVGQAPTDAATFDTPVSPAKGDSPMEGEAVDPLNAREDGPGDPRPATAKP